MGRDSLNVVLLYNTGSSSRVPVKSVEEGVTLIEKEREDVFDYYWENKPLDKPD